MVKVKASVAERSFVDTEAFRHSLLTSVLGSGLRGLKEKGVALTIQENEDRESAIARLSVPKGIFLNDSLTESILKTSEL